MLSRYDKLQSLYEVVVGHAGMSRPQFLHFPPEHSSAGARGYRPAKRINRLFLFFLVTQALSVEGRTPCLQEELSVALFARGTHVARSAPRCLGLCEREAVRP